jgi:cupin 2 domain-containing protein
MKPEQFQTILRSKILKIERITSRGHATPKGKWLKGRKNEWVMLLSGAAKLRFQNGRAISMKAGSSAFIPAGSSHRVDWTKPRVKTVWLAVHW